MRLDVRLTSLHDRQNNLLRISVYLIDFNALFGAIQIVQQKRKLHIDIAKDQRNLLRLRFKFFQSVDDLAAKINKLNYFRNNYQRFGHDLGRPVESKPAGSY